MSTKNNQCILKPCFFKYVLLLCFLACLCCGCGKKEPATPQEKVQAIRDCADETLLLYEKITSETDRKVEEVLSNPSAGYVEYSIADFLRQWDEFNEYGLYYLVEGEPDGSVSGGNGNYAPSENVQEPHIATETDCGITYPFDSKKPLTSPDRGYGDCAAGQLTEASLKRVVDGDTLYVEFSGEDAYVRLIGVNTPESVHPQEDRNTAEGADASEYTKNLLEDTCCVYLEFDQDMYDDYGRVLAYVWLSSDVTDMENMLNVKLLQSGHADIMTILPNDKYETVFLSYVSGEYW